MTAGPGDALPREPSTSASPSPATAPEQAAVLTGGGWRGYWQLLRFPAVFTAFADVLLGFALTHVHLSDAPLPLALLLLTSGCIYLAGMVFNDVADRHVDARERPHRPLPSGRVSLRAAVWLGTALLGVGLLSAAALRWVDPRLCGWNPLFVAALLVTAVALYDGLLKSTWSGPLAMGLCRFLNVILGASAAGHLFGRPFDNPQRWVATGLGLYVVGVTWFARTEATVSPRPQLIGGLIVVNLGLATLFGWLRGSSLEADPLLAMALLAGIALALNTRMLTAVRDPSPSQVQTTVRTLLLSIITLDAALIYAKTGDIVLATALAVGLLLPAMILGRVIRIT
jgi:4-hydroxybenzoate polyprenyltransferase